jgi:hypothetical protein
MNLNKLDCFSDSEWNAYIKEVIPVKAGKNFDVCSDCTVHYQRKMRELGKCNFPLKNLKKTAEYSN